MIEKGLSGDQTHPGNLRRVLVNILKGLGGVKWISKCSFLIDLEVDEETRNVLSRLRW